MWCHLSSLVGLILPGANILAPLFCWLSKKDSSRFVNLHGKESLNFQINMFLYSLLCCPFCCAGAIAYPIVGWSKEGQVVTWSGLGLSIVVIGALSIYEIVISIICGHQSQRG